MEAASCIDEDWELLKSFFPADWQLLAEKSGALKGLRQDKDVERCLRTLLLHVGCGFSLRETVARASQSGLADLSDVALLKRLRKSERWLHALCTALFRERGWLQPGGLDSRLRLVDCTEVSEPGKTGSQWRVHYCVDLPSLLCSEFVVTPQQGKGSGESFHRIEVTQGDHLLADRAYATGLPIAHVVSQGADVTVRLAPSNVRLLNLDGTPFNLISRLREMGDGERHVEWPLVLSDRTQSHRTPGRLCAVRKSQAAAAKARKKLRRRARRCVATLREDTLYFAEFVLVFTTVGAARLSTVEVLDLYRYRWQVELVFKRFKQIAKLGHLPKHDPASARAWLYGKLFVALLTEKLLAHAEAFSPWGFPLPLPTTQN